MAHNLARQSYYKHQPTQHQYLSKTQLSLCLYARAIVVRIMVNSKELGQASGWGEYIIQVFVWITKLWKVTEHFDVGKYWNVKHVELEVLCLQIISKKKSQCLSIGRMIRSNFHIKEELCIFYIEVRIREIFLHSRGEGGQARPPPPE